MSFNSGAYVFHYENAFCFGKVQFVYIGFVLSHIPKHISKFNITKGFTYVSNLKWHFKIAMNEYAETYKHYTVNILFKKV